MNDKLKSRLQREGIGEERSHILMSADLKYKRQGFTLNIPVTEQILDESIDLVKMAFHDAHQKIYKHHDKSAAVELVNIRATIIGMLPKIEMKEWSKVKEKQPTASRVGEMYYKGKKYRTNIYRRMNLKCGHIIAGPAVLEQEDTTTVLPFGFTAKVDKFGFVIVEREQA
jgi:N-methylhydantoinase A